MINAGIAIMNCKFRIRKTSNLINRRRKKMKMTEMKKLQLGNAPIRR